MTSLVGGPLGCFAPSQEVVSLQDPRVSILGTVTAPWKGPAPCGYRQGFAWLSLLQCSDHWWLPESAAQTTHSEPWMIIPT